MARAPKAAAQTSSSTEVANWDEELAKAAVAAAAQEAASGGGQFFSVKAGVLSFDGAPFPNNTMAAIIIDNIFENVFYEGKYDPNNLTPPTCFAFGRDEATMAPHATVFEHNQEQNDVCRGCPRNEWGSAETGRGKACRNTRRLALLPAGIFNKAGVFEPIEDADEVLKGPVGYLKLPVTSIKGYAGFVKQVATLEGRPPYGIFSKVTTVPDTNTQFKVVFESLGKIPNHMMAAVMKRNAEIKAAIDFPYNLDVEEKPAEQPRGRGRGQAAAKPAATGRKYSR